MMKRLFLIILAAFVVIWANSCQKSDGKVDYGNMLVYIPQATANGGIDNYYNVPSGGGENTYNFKAEEDVVNIFMGVCRSGKAAGDGFSVDIVVDDTATTAAAADIAGAEALPASAYELPSSVTVTSGSNSASFNLAVRKTALQAGKKYVLGIVITNPTKYELAQKNVSVVVVIDCDALLALI